MESLKRQNTAGKKNITSAQFERWKEKHLNVKSYKNPPKHIYHTGRSITDRSKKKDKNKKEDLSR